MEFLWKLSIDCGYNVMTKYPTRGKERWGEFCKENVIDKDGPEQFQWNSSPELLNLLPDVKKVHGDEYVHFNHQVQSIPHRKPANQYSVLQIGYNIGQLLAIGDTRRSRNLYTFIKKS